MATNVKALSPDIQQPGGTTMAAGVEAVTTHIQRAMPISRFLRLVNGVALVLWVLLIFSAADAGGILRSVGAALAFVPFYAAVHYLAETFQERMLSAKCVVIIIYG